MYNRKMKGKDMTDTEKIALALNVEVRDGWFYVGDLEMPDGSLAIDGNPWVTEEHFLEIVSRIVPLDWARKFLA